MQWPDPPTPHPPFFLAQSSPEPAGDVLSCIQAKTGFLQGTEASSYHLSKTLEPLRTPQTCPTKSYLGP